MGETARRSTRSPHKHVLTLENGDQTVAPEGRGVIVVGGGRQFYFISLLGKLLRFAPTRKVDVAKKTLLMSKLLSSVFVKLYLNEPKCCALK